MLFLWQLNVDHFPGLGIECALDEFHFSFREGIQCVVFADTDILACAEASAALANDDVSSKDVLTTEDLYTQSFAG